MANVRGLAMEPRGIGNTDLFDTHGILLETIRIIPGWNGHTHQTDNDRHTCQYPCRNCDKVLPHFGVPAERMGDPARSEYDVHMDAAEVHPW
jgi:hypothetical protein